MSTEQIHEMPVRISFDVLRSALNQLEEEELRVLQDELSLRLREREESWFDMDCIATAAQEADDSISLESVRVALAKIDGSLSTDVIAAREER